MPISTSQREEIHRSGHNTLVSPMLPETADSGRRLFRAATPAA
jgi:hypothetical protein